MTTTYMTAHRHWLPRVASCAGISIHLQTEPLITSSDIGTSAGVAASAGETSPRLAIKTGFATYSFAFNTKRPDVVAAILQQPADNHPGLCCGFNIAVPFSDRITLGLESDGLITWLEELTFSPTI